MQGMDNQSDERVLFERGLASGEKLLWTGRPVPGRLIEVPDLLRLSVGLLIAGMFLCFSLMFFSGLGEPGGPFGFMDYVGSLIFILFGVAAIAFGLGGVLKRRRRVRSRRYAITDQRVIIASTRSGFTTESVSLERIPRITSRIGANGVGTIALAEADKNFFWWKRYWPEALNLPFDVGIKYLYEIPNAEYVEGLLKNYVGRNEAEPALDAASAANSVDGYELDAPYMSHPPRSVQPLLALITVFCNGLFQFGILWMGVSLIGLRGAYPDVLVMVFISVFLLIGVAMVLSAIKMGLRALGLLRNGEAAEGVFHSKILRRDGEESDSFNRAGYIWNVVYHFKAIDGSEHQSRTSRSVGIAHVGNEEAEMKSDIPPRVFLLYSSSNPENNITIDQLPGRPKFDRPGTVYSGRPWILLAYLIVPALVLFIHVFWYYL